MGGLRGIDMFRKIPADLTSATTTGAILLAIFVHASSAGQQPCKRDLL